MIIYESGLIKLDYDPTTDILFVDIPTAPNLFIHELIKSYELIVEHVRNYDVKRLLLDVTKTQVEIEEESYTAIISNFVRDLETTRVQKVARVVSSSTMRENLIKKVTAERKSPFQFQTFTDVASAIEWLVQ